MFGINSLLFADAASPASAVSTAAATTRYQFIQPQSFSEWWQMPLLVLACLAVVGFVLYMYRRDSVELRPGVGLFLAIMRLAAFVGLLLFYLDLQKWSEQKEVQNSRALVLADTSISMGLGNSDLGSSSPADTRIAQVVTEFTAGRMLDDLRKTHDVVVWRFDQDLSRVATLPKVQDAAAREQVDAESKAARAARTHWLRYGLIAAAAVLALSALGYLLSRLIFGRRTKGWIFGLGATAAALAIFGALAYLSLDNPHSNLLSLVGLREPEKETSKPSPKTSAAPAEVVKVDWATALKPHGIETRLGECLHELINDERAQPVSAVILFTDGGQNAGLDPSAAIELAREAQVPVYIVGLGSDQRPVSARIADFAAPPRAYPGDSFTVTAEIEAQGMAGAEVDVELDSRPAGKVSAANPAQWRNEGSQRMKLPGDGKKERIKFQLEGIKELGRRTLQLQLKPPKGNLQQQPGDLVRETDVEIVDRKNRVLLLAGGPTREYQFLRNQLRRDKDTIVDVMLQTASGAVSQDANAILDHFPATMQELSEYDAIVAFDPDWTHLEPDPVVRDQRIALLEKWVAEEAGGLVLVAGPVYTDDWAQDRSMSKIRGLYPVEFNRLLIELKGAKTGSDRPGPIEFTREGQEAEFLWLGGSAAESMHNWGEFKGIYGYYRLKGKKAGATVYARYDDPDLDSSGEEAPIYMAGQLYGSGRVFYLGSGEMWRLRALDPDGSRFEEFYTKLLRHVSQGRLLRGSRRGTLAVDRDSYLLGSTVDIEARLTDAQHQPLDLPKVIAEVSPQNGAPQMVPLFADPSRKGTFHGQFSALEVGPHRIELPIPDSQEDPLSRQIIVKVPDLEKDNPQRNDALLNEIASGTGGRYYTSINAALGDGGRKPPLVGQLKDRSRETPTGAEIDKPWQQLWMTWLLCGICGFLCLEWLVRRLSRLA